MLAFPQTHADRATCSERAQHIHGPYGHFQKKHFPKYQVPGVLEHQREVYLWVLQIITGTLCK